MEVEVYYHAADHPDPFAHRDPAQLHVGRWYFHRTGGTYRGGSFKGLDLAFGGSAAHAGVLIRGIEPNMRWRGFCGEILDVVQQAGATRFITLGALLADAPHRQPVQVTGTAPDTGTARRLGLVTSKYG